MHVGHLGVAIIKMALLTYLLVGVAALIVVRRRRMQAARDEFMRTDPSELLARYARSGQPGYEASVLGATPHTPLPDWAYRDDAPQHPDAGSDPAGQEANRR